MAATMEKSHSFGDADDGNVPLSGSRLMSVPFELVVHDEVKEESWRVVAHNRQVYKGWIALRERVPESLERCLLHLCKHPMQRYPKRVFPLRGSPYKGAWEYEVTGGDRVFYVPNPENKTVTIYYAGKHLPPPAPKPPSSL